MSEISQAQQSKSVELRDSLAKDFNEEDAKSSHQLIKAIYLVANDIVTSRAWINSVASQYLSGQKFEIPAEYAMMLKLVV